MKNKKTAQVFSEYAIVIGLIAAVAGGMTVYLRRVLQARIHDTKTYMMDSIRDPQSYGGALPYRGTLNNEYEPYYKKVDATINRSLDQTFNFFDDYPIWTLEKTHDETTTIKTESEQLPPRDAD